MEANREYVIRGLQLVFYNSYLSFSSFRVWLSFRMFIERKKDGK